MSGHRQVFPAVLRSSDDRDHVVLFRPQRAKVDASAKWRRLKRDCDPDALLIEKLAKYEHDDREDDYRQRMLLNGLGLVVTATLIAFGVWLMTNIHDQPSHAFEPPLSPDGYPPSAAGRQPPKSSTATVSRAWHSAATERMLSFSFE
jgi:hypothetical protein